ncbi:MAG: hypothetical protein LBV23_05610 [Deltaproteobacteria bacterium]|jgi:hypothetical protein|nr:hypothetical protein [Deltaproteobacteria bacterium]
MPGEVKTFGNYFSIRLAPDGSFNYDKIELASRYCGFFCLLTNTPLSSLEVLAKYRAKDVIEKSFD